MGNHFSPRFDEARRRAGLVMSIILALAGNAGANEVFKCRTRAGTISYQDHECRAGSETLEAPMLPRAYVPPVVDPAATSAAAATVARAPVTQVRIEDPLPQMFRCSSNDGANYVSSDPTPRGRYVPLWTLGVDASGPGLVHGTIDPRYGAQYTYVEDRCRAMPRGELCGWWKQRADETGSQRRRAFNDQRAALDQEYAGARDALARFCR